MHQVRRNYKVDDLLVSRVDAMPGLSTELLPPRQQAALELLAPQSIGLDFYGDLLFTTETELRERPRRAQAMRGHAARLAVCDGAPGRVGRPDPDPLSGTPEPRAAAVRGGPDDAADGNECGRGGLLQSRTLAHHRRRLHVARHAA
ncbi:hypothetical protein LP420_25050 [Massilia sp. B-10]|nr:hypothetical protein LP420_25050 [Massilia sp. B-10]